MKTENHESLSFSAEEINKHIHMITTIYSLKNYHRLSATQKMITIK